MTTSTVPTLDSLRAMTVHERGLAFLDWVRAQDPAGTYYPNSIGSCALAQFGDAIAPGKGAHASAKMLHLFSDGSWLPILRDYREGDEGGSSSTASPIWAEDATRFNDLQTYAALTARLEIFLTTP